MAVSLIKMNGREVFLKKKKNRKKERKRTKTRTRIRIRRIIIIVNIVLCASGIKTLFLLILQNLKYFLNISICLLHKR